MNKKWWFLVILILGITVFFTYRDLVKSFFHQDEWLSFGQIIFLSGLGGKAIWQWAFPISQKLAHFNPLSTAIFLGEFRLFGLNFLPWTIISLTIHFLNSLLIFYLAWLLFKRKSLSLVTSLIFALNSLSHQAVSWVAISLNTQSCCLFVLLSLIFLIKNKYSLSIFAFAISLGFKEASVFLFFFLPFFWIILGEKRKPSFWPPFLALVFFYFGFRGWLFLKGRPEIESGNDLSEPPLWAYLFRFIALPIRALPQSLISADPLRGWSERIVYLFFPRFIMEDGVANPFIVEGPIFNLVCFVLTGILVCFIFFLYCYFKKMKKERLIKNLFFSITFVFSSSLPFIFIPGTAGDSPIFEPRNLYLTGIGSSLFLTIFFSAVVLKLKKKWCWLFLIPLLFFHYHKIQNDTKTLIADGQLRKSILNQISASYPVLPPKVVFYMESDRAYYGLSDEETIFPFQSGLGQTLLVWYYHHGEKFPACMFADGWLYQIEEQGYRFCQSRGFGYFRNLDDLDETFRANDLSPENLIAFEFHSEDESLVDITNFMRKRLKDEK